MTEPTNPTGIGATDNKRRFSDAPRWMVGALVGSLALNLLVLGLAAGALWHGRWGQVAGGGNLLGNLMAFSQTLPAPRRQELKALVREPRDAAWIHPRDHNRAAATPGPAARRLRGLGEIGCEVDCALLRDRKG